MNTDNTSQTAQRAPTDEQAQKRRGRIRLAIGIGLGAVAGFAYYYFIGCNSGTCPITSNPWISTVYGSVVGGVAAKI
jgi:hypothetical protein